MSQTTPTDPPEADEIELRQQILEALAPILDEEEACDAAIAAAAAVVRPPGLGDIVDHELLAAHDEIAQLRRQLEDARAAGQAYKRDRDRWKAVAIAHGCNRPGSAERPCEHYTDLFKTPPSEWAHD